MRSISSSYLPLLQYRVEIVCDFYPVLGWIHAMVEVYFVTDSEENNI